MTPLLLPLWLFRALSTLIWRLPGRPSMKMAEFSHVEAGSGLDMLDAAERERDPLLKRKYFRHALDELKHARLFRERARILATGNQRVEAVLDDAGFQSEHGIRAVRPLVEELGHTSFMAFVWLHERAGAAQFEVYAHLLRDDADSSAMFEAITKDEKFHVAYSRAELDRLSASGRGAEVRRALWWSRLKDLWQAWTRTTAGLGEVMAGFWLSMLYFLVVTPFGWVAGRRERMAGGLVRTGGAPSGAGDYARQLG